MAESAKEKDLSTTSLGLIAAYLLPGVIVLSAVGLLRPDIRCFFLEDGEHFTFAIAVALIIGLLLNGLRLALLSRWLFKGMSYRDSDFEGIEQGRFNELQAAIDEVFRLHQLYCALYLLFPLGLMWAIFHFQTAKDWVVSEYHRAPLWEFILCVALLVVVWRLLGRATLETYEFYHQIAMGILHKPLPLGPHKLEARVIAFLFSWGYYKRHLEYLDVLPPFGQVGSTVVLRGEEFSGTPAVEFGGHHVAALVAQSGKYLTVTVPNGAETACLTVTIQNRTVTSKEKFRVTPQITGFDPAGGRVGTTVTIRGISLIETTKVTFGGMKTRPNIVTDTEITAVVPACRTGNVNIMVGTPGGTATSQNEFNVTV